VARTGSAEDAATYASRGPVGTNVAIKRNPGGGHLLGRGLNAPNVAAYPPSLDASKWVIYRVSKPGKLGLALRAGPARLYPKSTKKSLGGVAKGCLSAFCLVTGEGGGGNLGANRKKRKPKKKSASEQVGGSKR